MICRAKAESLVWRMDFAWMSSLSISVSPFEEGQVLLTEEVSSEEEEEWESESLAELLRPPPSRVLGEKMG